METIEANVIKLTETVCRVHRSSYPNELTGRQLCEEGIGDVSIKFIQAICDQLTKVSF
jgi:hypothetical protein